MPKPSDKRLWNLPNQITLVRLVLAIIVFILIELQFYPAALGLFVIAAATDWLDGFLARRWGLITQLGRILDPFADKIIICGTFIILCAEPRALLPSWVVVIVVGRELFVTALRGYLEQHGQDFSAGMSGKLKMVAQCAAAISSLLLLALAPDQVPVWLPAVIHTTVAATVLLTLVSGLAYTLAALRLLRA